MNIAWVPVNRFSSASQKAPGQPAEIRMFSSDTIVGWAAKLATSARSLPARSVTFITNNWGSVGPPRIRRLRDIFDASIEANPIFAG